MLSDKRSVAELGREGDRRVAEYLKQNGYIILRRNWRDGRYGEIDIICENEKYIIFVEVKSRQKGTNYPAIEAVDRNKRIKIIKTSFDYHQV